MASLVLLLFFMFHVISARPLEPRALGLLLFYSLPHRCLFLLYRTGVSVLYRTVVSLLLYRMLPYYRRLPYSRFTACYRIPCFTACSLFYRMFYYFTHRFINSAPFYIFFS